MSQASLQFVPFLSAIENGFWAKLADLKLNVLKLDDSKKVLHGFYSNSDIESLPSRHSVQYSAFEENEKAPPMCFPTCGSLYVKNTIEDFKTCDFKTLLQDETKLIWDDIVSGNAIIKPHLLVRFLLITFADLKKYVFHYWFAFPAFVHVEPFTIKSNCSNLLSDVKSQSFLQNFQCCIDLYYKVHGVQPAFFFLCYKATEESELELFDLKDFDSVYSKDKKFIFGMSDPSTLKEYPGWPLRNYLTLISYHWSNKLDGEVDIICYRDRTVGGLRSIKHSLYLKVKLMSLTSWSFDCTGWEKNKKNKLGPRSVNLAESMDPVKLAESSINLNLKLMRWRLMPSLQLEKIAETKCLLLGSGTLGCNIARSLLAWGVHNITLVDSGKVSFSNPVRQTLFEFSDCSVSGGRPKAIAAAERLRSIFPSVNASGIELSIPMPGHPMNQNDTSLTQAQTAVEELEKLIDLHDVIFLLMDTRESRWLPTLLSAAKEKLVINVALGFDSYLVIRHGILNSDLDYSSRLGCYFCNDVVAPGNSLHDRTLDQQCTVTRPGVSMIASALGVELLVSLIQHPLGFFADPESEDTTFGPVPHQIRGFLSHSKVFYPSTEAFSKCTACSKSVIEAYKEKGFDFLFDVFNSTHRYLEDLTGLTLLHQQTADCESDILELSENESI